MKLASVGSLALFSLMPSRVLTSSRASDTLLRFDPFDHTER